MEATLRTPEGSDGSARKAQTHEKGSRAGFLIMRGGLKDRSHARGCCVGAACRSSLDRRRGSLTPPRPTRRPALSRHGHSPCLSFSSLPPGGRSLPAAGIHLPCRSGHSGQFPRLPSAALLVGTALWGGRNHPPGRRTASSPQELPGSHW